MNMWIRWLCWSLLCVLLLGSCAADTSGSGGAGGDGAALRGRSADPPSAAAMPASLRMAVLRARQAAPGHDFADQGASLRARVGANGAEADVDIAEGRVDIVPTAANREHAFALHTVHVGRQRARESAPRELAPIMAERAEGQEAVLARAGVEERYLAGPLGLEQSYVISARPEGAGPLAIEVAFEGLAPQTAAGAEDIVSLVDEGGATRALYRDIAAVDADGRELAARMNVGEGGVTLVVDDAGAAYPVVVDPLVVTEQAKLLASDGAAGNGFGVSVSVSADTAIVGATYINTNTGAAYVFVRNGATWSQQAKLVASDGVAGDRFGVSVGLSGDTAVIGAPSKDNSTGAAYVFVRSGATWFQQAKLVAGDGAPNDAFGASVSLSGDTAVIGAFHKNNNTGAAYAFVRSGAAWSQQAVLLASNVALGDLFGYSVSLSGDTAVIGAPSKGNFTGAAYVFVRSGTAWSQQAQLGASDGVVNDYFGYSVSVSGDTAIVGAPFKVSNTGAAYVFVRGGTTWSPQAELWASDAATAAWFGTWVSVSGNTAIVGAPDKALQTGAAYLFARSGATWSESAKLSGGDSATGDRFGDAVHVSGNTAIVGAWAKAGKAGAAYVFAIRRSLGDPCTSAAECTSGFCADGVCCNLACDAGPCDACGVAAGAAVDGTCTLLTGPTCDDGNACTQVDTCQAGTCTGSNPITCSASDQCHTAGACDPATGACSNPPKGDGSACSDGNACTQTDTCQAGSCTGASPVTCTAQDQCHVAGTCDPSTGVCSNPNAADGVACDDGSALSKDDACTGGVCAGVPLCTGVACSASDQCHVAGTCDPATGLCSNPNAADGTACDDGDANTVDDVCTAGVCAGVDHCIGVTCTASDECHDAGTCIDHATGACDKPAKADGTPCSVGSCQQGTCAAEPDAGAGGSGGMGTGGSGGSPSSSSSTSSSSTSSSGGAGGDNPSSSSSSSGGISEEGGCGCRTAGGAPDDGRGWLGALGLALVLARRRRAAEPHSNA